jgi:hypothetical protein
MIKRILFIDTDSSYGHVPFNAGWLSKLAETPDVCIHVAGRKSYFDKIKPPQVEAVRHIPHTLYLSKDWGGFINRLFMWLRYVYVGLTNKLSVYDYVIFSNYDEIVLFFTRMRRHVFLVEHNLAKLDSKIKLFFFQRISKRCRHIVFNEYMAKRLTDLGITNPVIIPHALSVPFLLQPRALLSTIDSRFQQGNFAKILFCPSFNSSDTGFLSRLVADERFLDFIEKNGILFVMKCRRPLLHGAVKSKNILTLSALLSIEQYSALFIHSFALLIAYPERFKYRVSNVLNECISNNKLCFMSDIASLRYYAKHIRYPYYFSDVPELIRCISDAIERNVEAQPDKYLNTDELLCDFSELWEQKN